MLLYHDGKVSIIFGDETLGCPREFLMENHSQETLLKDAALQAFRKQVPFENLMLLRQCHSAVGFSVTKPLLQTFLKQKHEGDFLVTNCRFLALGVYTADCLPIILYDAVKQVIGICHAGWVGSLKRVAVAALEKMMSDYSVHPQDVHIFFGPAATVCCYEVQESFKEKLQAFSFHEEVLIQRDNKLFFDMTN